MKKAGSTAVASLVLIVACLITSGGAGALSPPPVGTASIVFDNGGRIVSMNADGSGRTYLTRGERKATWAELFGQNGDAEPHVSPDGTRMVFLRSRGFSDGIGKTDLMLAKSDGSDEKKLFTKQKSLGLGQSPRWTADGTRLVMVKRMRKGNRLDFSVVTVKPDGRQMKTIWKLPTQKEGPRQDTYFEPQDPVVSPDGKRLLVEVDDRFMDNANHLELISIASGKRTSLGPQTYSGSWSEDGKSIIYVSSRGSKSQFCAELDDGCFDSGDIFTVNADGSGRKRLTKTAANEDKPSWSPNSDRILYTSNEAMPRSLPATEIYSMAIDGSCRVALTNGAPASFSPSWVNGGGTPPDEIDCDQPPPAALAEVVPPSYSDYKPIYWAGSNADGRLLSSAGFSFGFDLDYDDCDLNLAGRCGEAAMVLAFPICYWSGFLASIYGEEGDEFGKRRGATVVSHKRPTDGFTMLAGRSMSFVFGELGIKKRSNFLSLIDNMRPVGQSEPMAGDLPAPQIPLGDLKRLRKVEGAVERLGSQKAASKKLGMSMKKIDENLRFGKRIRSLGPIQSFKCPRVKESDSGLDDFSLRSSRRDLVQP